MRKNSKQHDYGPDAFTLLVSQQLKVRCVRELAFAAPRRWRFDYALPDYRVALEVEGGAYTRGRHVRPQGFIGDIEKYNTATLLGWHLLRCLPEEQYSDKVLNMLRAAVANFPSSVRTM